ncbi:MULTISPECIES: ribosomal protein S18-alanine N-acetyltransferase [unclassified Haladaptatus]|uniref:ribosomal protein S18-alanine N-acetyltransferase n=1 Tax=unclassified Haladaptatus TaxID=2622732 RepID=UPI0023E7AC6C|nr:MULTISPECIES: ribosomal protein S18-alanine N-acetyltransferase [unclassified Haladaptatus]
MTTTAEGAGGPVEIREATLADLLAVFRIERQSFPQPWPYAAFEFFVDEPGFLVAEAGEVVGYVVADIVPNHGRPIGHIKDFAVAPDHRGQGIGARLLERALVVLATNAVETVKLEVRESNEAAQSLYRRYGFMPHHRIPRYYEDGEDALVFVKSDN